MNSVGKHSLVTIAFMLLNHTVLKHNHLYLTGDDLAVALVLANAAAHGATPYVAAVNARLLSWVQPKPKAA